MRAAKGEPFMHVEEDGGSGPTFSFDFLEPRVGKYEARFILGIADEYSHVIEALGSRAVAAILDVKPRLTRRLGLPGTIEVFLEDAQSYEHERRKTYAAPDFYADGDVAEGLYESLIEEYQRHYEPRYTMDAWRLTLLDLLVESQPRWAEAIIEADEAKAQMIADRDRLKPLKDATTLAWRALRDAEEGADYAGLHAAWVAARNAESAERAAIARERREAKLAAR